MNITKHYFQRLARGWVALAFVAALLGSLNASAGRNETLIVVREQGANSLDIQGLGTNRPAYGTSWNVYDRLLSFGVKTAANGDLSYDYQSLKPELAASWRVSEDGKYIDFMLRKDAVFHDGSSVTAADVQWSFARALAVGGFPTFQMKAGSIESAEQFEVVDKHTFRLHLLRDDKLTLPDLAVPVAAIYNASLAKQHATDADPWALEWLKTNDAGSGAYQVEKFEPGVQVVLSRFDAWRSGPLPKMEKVVERVVPSSSTRRAMSERGDVDVSFDLPPKDFAQLIDNPKVKVQGIPVENFMWFLDMNVNMPPFDKLKVRQAIAAAIPYQAIFDSVSYGRAAKLFGGEQAQPTSIDWPQAYPYNTDLKKAKALLTEAGYPDGFKTSLYYNLGLATWSEPIALQVQQNLRQIGIELTLEKIPGANWRGEMGKKSMPFLINDMGGWLNYPDYFFFWNYHSQNGVFNTMSYQNPEMDAYIDAARFAPDQASYIENVKGFIGKAFADVPRIPLFQSNLDVATRLDIQGYQYWFHRQLDYRQLYRK
ncbi:ABC transporter substrate-binding protein [Zhongshania sp.]|uniref:ABC transporter substrate-binding protein n=1 Tax=Zhongshania sp. TaxID=1971902 RepID=UPI0035670638